MISTTTTQTTQYKTIWALGVPLDQREAIAIAFPDKNFHFITISTPLSESANRIKSSSYPAVASWAGASTVDYDDFLRQTNIPQVKIGPARLLSQSRNNSPSSMPYGFYLEACEKLTANLFSNSAEIMLKNDDWQPSDLQRNECELAIKAFIEHDVGAFNFGLDPTTKPLETKKRTVLVIADQEPGYSTLQPDRTSQYVRMMETAKEQYPGWDRIFVVNGDAAIPQATVFKIRAAATAIHDGRYTPEMLSIAEVVITREKSIAIESKIRNIKYIEPGTTDPEIKDPAAVQREFIANWLVDTNYVDPVENKPLSLVDAAILAKRRALTFHFPADAKIASWTKKMPPQVLAAKTVNPSFTAIAKKKASAPTATRFKTPSWLALQDNWKESDAKSTLSVLTHELHLLPSFLRELFEEINLITLSQRSQELGASDAEHLARTQPEFLYRLYEQKIRSTNTKHALIFDLSNRASRLFSRVCGDLGVRRIFVPYLPFDLMPERWRYVAKGADAVTTLSDICVTWEPGHLAYFKSIGFPEKNFFGLDPQLAPAPWTKPVINNIYVALDNAWPKDIEKEPAKFQVFAASIGTLANLFDFRLCFYFSQSAIINMTEWFLDYIYSNPKFQYEVAGAEFTSHKQRLDNASILITDSGRHFNEALSIGCKAFYINHAGRPALVVDDIVGSTGALNLPLTNWLEDYVKPERITPQPKPRSRATTKKAKKHTVDSILEFADNIDHLWPVLKTALNKNTLFINRAAGLATEEQLQGKYLYLKQFLNIRVWGQVTAQSAIHEMTDVDLFVKHDVKPSQAARLIERSANRLGKSTIYVNDGLIGSINSLNDDEPLISIVMDEQAPYFYKHTSGLADHLAKASPLSTPELLRIRALMDFMVTHRVGSDNVSPYVKFQIPDDGKSVTLLIDQYADDESLPASALKGGIFTQMLNAARAADPTGRILVLSNAAISKRKTVFTKAEILAAKTDELVNVIQTTVNAHSLFELSEKIFVISTPLGYEALLSGKEVWSFAPSFYSHLGLTRDYEALETPLNHRSVEDIFSAVYLARSRYYHPQTKNRVDLETLLQYVVDKRSWKTPASEGHPQPIGFPVLQPQDPLADLNMAQFDTVWASHMAPWKHDFVRRLFPGKKVNFFPMSKVSIMDFEAKIKLSKTPLFLVWGDRALPGLSTFAKQHDVPIFHMEDGFVRSVGLGAHKVLPYSYCLDSRGIYFDARRPSDLEHILENYDFDGNPELLEEARKLRMLVISNGLSKYNFAHPRLPGGPYGLKDKKRILVIGQVEDDASILLGGPIGGITNNEVVLLARQENPDAQIIYKIHPDVLSGARAYNSDPREVADICEISTGPVSLHDAFYEVDHVYSITSLAGFEALIRNIKVTTVGLPFYAGWGLTDARMSTPRRTRTLTVDQIFAAAYLLYARYIDPIIGQPLELRDVIQRICDELGELSTPR